jgi:hypothetical protein
MPNFNFWSYWSNATGFDYNAWFNSYQIARSLVKKSRISQTRRIFNAIRVASGNALETNLYPIPTLKQDHLERVMTPLIRFKSYNILCEMVKCIRPEVIIAHGREASKLAYGMPCCGEIRVNSLDEGKRTDSSNAGQTINAAGVNDSDRNEKDRALVVTVISVPDHFGRGFSEERGKKLGEQAAAVLVANSHSK